MARVIAYVLLTAFVIFKTRAISEQENYGADSRLWSSTEGSSSWNSESGGPYSFVCHKDGLFPDIGSCSSYIQCSNGEARYLTCPADKHYSAVAQRCKPKCEAHCDPSIACPCGWETCGSVLPSSENSETMDRHFECPSNGFFPHPSNCSSYVHCLNGHVDFLECPDGKHFNSITEKCEEKCEAYCDQSMACQCGWSTCDSTISLPIPVAHRSSAIAEDFVCGRDGTYKNPGNCSTFILCSNGNPYVMNCPANLHYSRETKRCEAPCDAKCDPFIACKCKWSSCIVLNCFLPKKTGSCDARIPRWYYNPDKKSCEVFIYGGCDGNSNNFESKQSCEDFCIYNDSPINEAQQSMQEQDSEDRPQPDCESPPEKGDCYARIPRYFYDEKTGKCEKFFYGGCGGNGNNYITERQCYSKCKPPQSQTEVQKYNCTQKKDEGPCQAYKIRYYFNTWSGQCERFIYGGCQGNKNNFPSVEKCEQVCLRIHGSSESETEQPVNEADWPEPDCSSPPEKGPCGGSFTRYYYDEEEGECKTFTYGGCRGNANKYITKNQCERSCKKEETEPPTTETDWPEHDCTSPPEKGPCRGRFTRYYYDEEEGECKTFTYGGCTGNGNKYITKGQCERNCKKEEISETEENICRLEKDKGPCHGSIPKYFFNFRTGHCERFTYGGCGGNKNNFRTFQKCEQTCLRRSQSEAENNPPKNEADWPEPDCSSPPEKGPCRGSFTRYYYDEEEGECKTFTYGGCRGNRNKYITKSQCERSCKKEGQSETEGSVCTLEKDKGPCNGYIPKYFFNSKTGVCERFIYGGCGGNGNNFPSEMDCELVCFLRSEPDDSETEVYPPVTEENLEDVTAADCLSPPDRGPCKGYFPRFYYDAKAGVCKRFIYGGCNGNKNNYYLEAECNWKCKKGESEPNHSGTEVQPLVREENAEDETVTDCTSSPERGPCRGYLPRYYYDAKAGVCKRFIYGGCKGNKNNYYSEAECRMKCRRGEREPNYSETEVYPPVTDENAEDGTEADCTSSPNRGPCKGYLPRYYYDSEAGVCKRFIYGGCKGNKNNYYSEAECRMKCRRGESEPNHSETEVQPLVREENAEDETEADCTSSPERGPCRGYMPRYYYDAESGVCKRFIYGGCKGNKNNYYSEAECRMKCRRGESEAEPQEVEADWPEPDCSSPPEKGPCRGSFTRYYYDEEEGECKTFTYGGCRGNGNKYIMKSQCERSCKKEESSRFSCPLPNGMFQPPSKDSFHDVCTYYQCNDNRATLMKCPAGHKFDTWRGECVPTYEPGDCA